MYCELGDGYDDDTDQGRATQRWRSSAELGVVGADSGAVARWQPRQREADHERPVHADADEASRRRTDR